MKPKSPVSCRRPFQQRPLQTQSRNHSAQILKIHRLYNVGVRTEFLAQCEIPLPIGSGQTISQPFIVAFMIEALVLEGGERVLEIGAGSGYAAAVLAEIAGEVYAIERIGQLAKNAAINLQNAGYHNVHIKHADGTLGWAEMAPFDAILVSASAPSVPAKLKAQLKIGGRLVMPVGSAYAQQLVRIKRKSETAFAEEDLADVRFVPLIEGGLERGRRSNDPPPGSSLRSPK